MNEQKKQKQQKQIQEMAELVETQDSWTRKRFDYQERWHGWQSPVGLGIGAVLSAAALFLVSLAWVNFFG
jgi:cell division protein FtsX